MHKKTVAAVTTPAKQRRSFRGEQIRSILAFKDRFFREFAIKYIELLDLERMFEEYGQAQPFPAIKQSVTAIELVFKPFQSGGHDEVDTFTDPEDIQKVYRRIALLVHPDRAKFEAERRWCTNKMAAANDAYEQRDFQQLIQLYRSLSSEAQLDIESEISSGIVDMLRPAAYFRSQAETVDRVITMIERIDMKALMMAVNESSDSSPDVLQMISERLDTVIPQARQILLAKRR